MPSHRRPKPIPTLSPERARELREALGLADMATGPELAAALNCGERTIDRLGARSEMIAGTRRYSISGTARRLREVEEERKQRRYERVRAAV